MVFLVSGVKTIKLEIPRHTKTVSGAVKQATKTCNFFATLPQNELNSDVARFASHVQTCLATTQVSPFFENLLQKVPIESSSTF